MNSILYHYLVQAVSHQRGPKIAALVELRLECEPQYYVACQEAPVAAIS